MKFFEMRVFLFAAKWINITNIIFFYQFIGLPNRLEYTHLFPLHNEPSPMPVGWKLEEG